MKKYLIIGLIVFAGLAVAGYFSLANTSEEVIEEPIIEEPKDRQVSIDIESEMTFSIVVEEAGLDHSTMQALFTAAEEIYDLSRIRVGRQINFIFDKDTDEFKQLIYPIDTEEELFVTKDELGEWLAERKAIDYEIKLKTVDGVINDSLYLSALEQGVDERAIIALADVFAWTIDFGWGIRQGDTYKFIYEERYRNGQYVMPGEILAAKFVNAGKDVEGFYFHDGEEYGYYAPNGESLQKIFLKNPVDFKYISSGYTTGRRYVEAFNVSTGHRAIDYAAAYGTPIRSVGEGVVARASWSSQGYGYMISIRHNSVYTTNYAHLSRFAVSAGQRVGQGQTIGYVGSTGFSTGPHLHFEIVKNGTKVNPLTLDLPADKAVAEDKMEEFNSVVAKWQPQLD